MSTPTLTEEETVQPKSDAPDELSEEAMSPEHKELARDMFEKITEYLNGELAGAKLWAALSMTSGIYCVCHVCVFVAYSH